MRATVIFLLILLVPTAATGEDDLDRYFRLWEEYSRIEKDQRWPAVKRRRQIVAELEDLSSDPGTIDPVPGTLGRIFARDGATAVRVPALLAIGRRGGVKELRSVVMTAIVEKNDVYMMLLPEALGSVREDVKATFGPWLVKRAFLPRSPVARAAMVRSVGLLGTKAASEKITAILTKKRGDERLRYECLIALARIDGTKAIPVLMPYLGDPSPFLREAAVTAASLIRDSSAVDLVLSRVKDPEPLVRETVAVAIRRLGAKEHLHHVVEMLGDERLRVVAAARDVLEAMTGQEFGFDAGAWTAWLLDPEKKPAKPPAGGDTVSRYYGMEILSDRVIFLVDASGSMRAGEPSRIEVARKELATTLSKLNKKTLVNVAAFGGSPRWWSSKARPATPKARGAAMDFVESLSVGGGTNLYDTLVGALEQNRSADTIFLLGDGCPSAGRVVEHDEIRVRIRWLNRMRKVRIHTIAFVDRPVPLTRPRVQPKRRETDTHEAADLLLRLAEENDGTYVRREN